VAVVDAVAVRVGVAVADVCVEVGVDVVAAGVVAAPVGVRVGVCVAVLVDAALSCGVAVADGGEVGGAVDVDVPGGITVAVGDEPRDAVSLGAGRTVKVASEVAGAAGEALASAVAVGSSGLDVAKVGVGGVVVRLGADVADSAVAVGKVLGSSTHV
jgi:hypothetical protein